MRTVDLAAEALAAHGAPEHGDPPIQRKAPERGLFFLVFIGGSADRFDDLVEASDVHLDPGAHRRGQRECLEIPSLR